MAIADAEPGPAPASCVPGAPAPPQRGAQRSAAAHAHASPSCCTTSGADPHGDGSLMPSTSVGRPRRLRRRRGVRRTGSDIRSSPSGGCPPSAARRARTELDRAGRIRGRCAESASVVVGSWLLCANARQIRNTADWGNSQPAKGGQFPHHPPPPKYAASSLKLRAFVVVCDCALLAK
jgi:hypothetical protein